MTAKKQFRPDRETAHRKVFERNKNKILKTQNVCAICGKPVDKRLKWPDPMSRTVDHIVPVAKGGHPSDLSNLQLTHMICNRLKSDKLVKPGTLFSDDDILISNRNLPQSRDWAEYKG